MICFGNTETCDQDNAALKESYRYKRGRPLRTSKATLYLLLHALETKTITIFCAERRCEITWDFDMRGNQILHTKANCFCKIDVHQILKKCGWSLPEIGVILLNSFCSFFNL